jgi:hypothetical protein
MGIFGYSDNNTNESIVNKIDRKLGDAASFVKSSATSLYNKATGKEQPTGLYGTSLGGKKKRSKGKRGGYRASTPLNNIASFAASYNGVKTAQPHNWVGGKSRKGYRKNKSRRNKSRRMRR